jgi:hypothetical protein
MILNYLVLGVAPRCITLIVKNFIDDFNERILVRTMKIYVAIVEALRKKER